MMFRPSSKLAVASGVFARFVSSLKGRIVLGVSLLVIIALAVSDVIGLVQLQSYLSKRVDSQINSALATTSRVAERLSRQGQVFRDSIVRRAGPPGIQAPSPVLVVVYGSSGNTEFVRYNQLGSIQEPKIPTYSTVVQLAEKGGYFSLPGGKPGGSNFRARVIPLRSGAGYVLVAASLDEMDSTISHLRSLDLAVGFGVLVILIAMTYLVILYGMRPLAEIEDATDAIARGDLSVRIENGRSPYEVQKLSSAFNAMLERIQGAFSQVQASERSSKNSQEELRRFVADAGHELRTPLTSIMGYSELLQQSMGADWESARGYSRRIHKESQRMSSLVEELLLLASLDQRKPLRIEKVDLLSLVADGVQDARVVQPERDIRLEPLSPNQGSLWAVPVFVSGDEENLRQVVSNLINNALFHTPADIKVVVRVGVVPEEAVEASPRVAIEVEDKGPGINKDALEHLFERFYRVDNSRRFDHGGFGLGLSVVDSVVRAHDGIVRVSSTEGEGTCFRVELPGAFG